MIANSFMKAMLMSRWAVLDDLGGFGDADRRGAVDAAAVTTLA